jgi:hypothetical protein
MTPPRPAASSESRIARTTPHDPLTVPSQLHSQPSPHIDDRLATIGFAAFDEHITWESLR